MSTDIEVEIREYPIGIMLVNSKRSLRKIIQVGSEESIGVKYCYDDDMLVSSAMYNKEGENTGLEHFQDDYYGEVYIMDVKTYYIKSEVMVIQFHEYDGYSMREMIKYVKDEERMRWYQGDTDYFFELHDEMREEGLLDDEEYDEDDEDVDMDE